MRRALVLAIIGIWAVPAPGTPPARHEEMRPVMGTLATVQVWADDQVTAVAAVDTAFAVLVAADSLLSTWNLNSPLSRLNAAPSGTWVPVGPDVCRVLRAATEVAGLTAGAFDPTVLPLMRLWGFRGGAAAVPDSATLGEALTRVDWQAVDVADERARLSRPGMAVDLGGIAKGYALDLAAAALARVGARGGTVDLGGNLVVFGEGPGHEVGVVDPRDPGVLLLTIPLDRGAVATSGQYERFVTVADQAYGHVLDPRTGWPVASGCSATVIAPQALWADALATAVVVLGQERGLALLEDLEGIEGVVVNGARVCRTSGLPARE